MSFEVRGFNLCESILRHTPEQLRRFIRRMKTLNMNTLIVHYDYGWKQFKDIILEECEKANVEIVLMTFGPRTFLSYVEWNKKWFAKREDGSTFNETLECETYLCPFEKEGLEAFEYGAKKWLEALPPQIKHVHMRAADGQNFCKCEKCRSLPEHEKWQPFVDIFVKSVLETKPELKFETDVYVKRYCIPSKSESFSKMSNIMFDTFYRYNAFPLGSTADRINKSLIPHATTIEPITATTINEYYLYKLTEWTTAFPNKVYIHENAMKQSFFGNFQYATSTYLKDLETFKKLGVQGVCYEAYEPGYFNFAEMFEILARALNGETVDYQETEIERVLQTTPMSVFCDDMSFPLERYIQDPFKLRCAQLYRRFWAEQSIEALRDYVEFAFDNSDVLDSLFIGFCILESYKRWGVIKFNNLSCEAEAFANTSKLWDYMENIPLNVNPVEVCKKLVLELVEKAEKI